MNNGYVISGTLFGDEGKGTFVDYLAHEKQIRQNVRYNGGSQARHTVINKGTSHKFGQLGSSMFMKNNKTYLSRNTIVNLFDLYEEARIFSNKIGVPISYVLENVYIDKKAYVVTPYHKLIGMIKELSMKENRRGITASGVSQTMVLLNDEGIGLQVSDLIDMDDKGIEKIKILFEFTKEYFKKYSEKIDKDLLNELIDENDIYYLTENLNKEYMIDCYRNLIKGAYFSIVNDIKEFYTPDNDILFEGSQGLLIDAKYGIKPNTTKIDTTNHFASGLCEEINYNPILIGASRAFASRHGRGILPTKDDMLQEAIDDVNQSSNYWQGNPIYGWYDAVLMRYSQKISNNDQLFISGLDQLSNFEIIKICNSYIYTGIIDDEFRRIFEFYKDNNRIFITDIKENSDYLKLYLEKCIPVYIEIIGWNSNIRNIKKYDDLPCKCNEFIELIEKLVDVPISLIGVGPTRDDKIRRILK